MILTAHQPQYLPWLGLFDKMDQADIFILLDTVQFKKNEWQNRNRIKGSSGWQWLTVPVQHRFTQRINEVEIAGNQWIRKHIRSLELAYARAPHLGEESALLDSMYSRHWKSLAELNVHGTMLLADRLGIETRVELSSSLDSVPDEQPDERLIHLCKEFGADTYLAGAGGIRYMDMSRWQAAGIRVMFQRFKHPVHPQGSGGFISGLSAVDFLFHCGAEGFCAVRDARMEAA